MNESFKINNQLQEIYEKQNNAISNSRNETSKDKVSNIIKVTNKINTDKIIEIGAGDGAILNRLSELDFGSEYFATEITEGAVDTIKSRNIQKLKNVILFDGYKTPFDNNEFDLVILSHVLEHVEYPRKLIYESARIGKYVFIEVPLEDNRKLSELFTLTDVGHINFYSIKTIKILIQSCGLSIESSLLTYPNRSSKNFVKSYKRKIISYLPKLSKRIATSNYKFNCSILVKK